MLPFLILVMGLPASPQSVALRGKVWDPVQKSGIPGAEVALNAGKLRRVTISVADGSYVLTGLKKGQRVTATFRRAGYSPDPRKYEVLLSTLDNVKDVELLRDTADASYWDAWSGAVKSFVDAQTADPQKRVQMYTLAWSRIGAFGVGPEGQVQAARKLSEIAPESLRSGRLSSLASIDPSALRAFEAEVQTALQGDGKLSKWDSIPPDVAEVVVASQLSKQQISQVQEHEFLTKYEVVWGTESMKDLSATFAHNTQRLETAPPGLYKVTE